MPCPLAEKKMWHDGDGGRDRCVITRGVGALGVWSIVASNHTSSMYSDMQRTGIILSAVALERARQAMSTYLPWASPSRSPSLLFFLGRGQRAQARETARILPASPQHGNPSWAPFPGIPELPVRRRPFFSLGHSGGDALPAHFLPFHTQSNELVTENTR
jgi:hypothetical protein